MTPAEHAAAVEHERVRYRRAVETEHELRVELARVIEDRLDALGELSRLGRSPWWPEHAHRRPDRHPRPRVAPGPRLARALRALEVVKAMHETEAAA